MRLWIKPSTDPAFPVNPQIDQWNAHKPTAHTTTFNMVAGQTYDVKLEYRELTGAALMRLLWSSPSTPEEVIEPMYINAYHVDGREGLIFADAVKSSRGAFESPGSGQPAPGKDANGWPLGNGSLVIWEGASHQVRTGTYQVRFTGQANVALNWANVRIRLKTPDFLDIVNGKTSSGKPTMFRAVKGRPFIA